MKTTAALLTSVDEPPQREYSDRVDHWKGGLLTDSFRWILNNSEFQRWREGG